MTTAPTLHFLLLYRLPTRELTVEEFGEDQAAAVAAYAAREEQHREDANVEVVLVAADSLDTIRTTHSHYFADDDAGLLDGVSRVLSAVGPRR